jgi:hypothetical protein
MMKAEKPPKVRLSRLVLGLAEASLAVEPSLEGSLTSSGAISADHGFLDISGVANNNLSGGTLSGGVWQAGGSERSERG